MNNSKEIYYWQGAELVCEDVNASINATAKNVVDMLWSHAEAYIKAWRMARDSLIGAELRLLHEGSIVTIQGKDLVEEIEKRVKFPQYN